MQPMKRIDNNNRQKNPKFKQIHAAENEAISEYVASPRQRVITEFELLNSLIGNKSVEEINQMKKLSKSVAFGNVLLTKHSSKQFGNEECVPYSKKSKLLNQQHISLKEKYDLQRMTKEERSNKVPWYMKGGDEAIQNVDLQNEMDKIRKNIRKNSPRKKNQGANKGNQVFKTVSRERWKDTRMAQPSTKFSNDCGLGDELNNLNLPKNVYMSQLGRDEQFHVIQENKRDSLEHERIVKKYDLYLK